MRDFKNLFLLQESENILQNQDKYNIDNVREILRVQNIILLENKYIDAKPKCYV